MTTPIDSQAVLDLETVSISQPTKWIEPKAELAEMDNLLRGDNRLVMATASAEPGLDLSAPVMRGTEFQVNEARQSAYAGRTLPYKINLGPPRVYMMDVKDPNGELFKVSASEEWTAAYNRAFVDALGGPDKLASHKQLETLWGELHQESAAAAREHGYDFYVISNAKGRNEGAMESPFYLANPAAVKITDEETLGVMPGLKEAPAVQDLVLYHGGGRKYGVVELEHRPTGEGEGFDPVPVLRDTPAIWASDQRVEAMSYAGSYRPQKGENPYDETSESQLYYLDAPNALVAEVETKRLSMRQADATIAHILKSDGSAKPPDVLKLYRNSDTEFFVPEHYEPGLIRVVGWDRYHDEGNEAELPPVAVGATDFDSPSENFCRVMQARAARLAEQSQNTRQRREAEIELDYWTERCEASRPLIGKEGVNQNIAQIENQIQLYSPVDPWSPRRVDQNKERRRTILDARLRYWHKVRDNLESTPSGARLKDPAALAQPEIELLQAVYDGNPPPRPEPAAAPIAESETWVYPEPAAPGRESQPYGYEDYRAPAPPPAPPEVQTDFFSLAVDSRKPPVGQRLARLEDAEQEIITLKEELACCRRLSKRVGVKLPSELVKESQKDIRKAKQVSETNRAAVRKSWGLPAKGGRPAQAAKKPRPARRKIAKEN